MLVLCCSHALFGEVSSECWIESNRFSEHGGERSHSVAILFIIFFFFAELVREGPPSGHLQHLRLLCSTPWPSRPRHRNPTRLRPSRRNRRYPKFLCCSSQRVYRTGYSLSFLLLIIIIIIIINYSRFLLAAVVHMRNLVPRLDPRLTIFLSSLFNVSFIYLVHALICRIWLKFEEDWLWILTLASDTMQWAI